LEIAKLQGQISALKAKDIGLEKQAEMEYFKRLGIKEVPKKKDIVEIDTGED